MQTSKANSGSYFQPQSSGAISFKFAVYLLRLHSPRLALEDVITLWK
jgi:hypothetical protein